MVIQRRFVFIVFGLSLFFLSRPVLFGQVLRRDPAEAPAPLVIHKHTYKPEGQLRAWLFRFHPFASQHVRWDDNIFLDPPYEKEEDYVFDSVFGVRTDWRMGRHETLLGYEGNYQTFARHPKENTLESLAELYSQWNFDWFFIDIGNRFSQKKIPEPEEEDIVTERSTNEFWVHAGLYGDRIGTELSYQFNWNDFVDPDLALLDHDKHTATLGTYYLLREDSKLAQKMYAFMEFKFGAFRFRERILSDSNWASGVLGVKGTLFDRLLVSIKIGYAGLDPAGNGAIDDTRDFRGTLYEALVTYMPAEEQAFTLTSSRALQPGAGSNFRVFDRLEGSYELTLFETLHLKPSLFLDHANPSKTRSLTRMGGSFEAAYHFRPWMSLGTYYKFVSRTGTRIAGLSSVNYRNHQIGFWLTLYV
ncbi:MAG: hypothetical protein ACYS47_10025 [Planctomycetota bacterium]